MGRSRVDRQVQSGRAGPGEVGGAGVSEAVSSRMPMSSGAQGFRGSGVQGLRVVVVGTVVWATIGGRLSAVVVRAALRS